MQNPGKCTQINNKLSVKYSYTDVDTSGVAFVQVNPSPVSDIHVQRSYTDGTIAASARYITEPYGTQYTYNNLFRNNARAWQVFTNTAPLVIQVRLTLVDSTTNNEEIVILTTNGGTLVNTPKATYKACNNIEIIGTERLQAGQRIHCRAASGQNGIQAVIGPDFYYNPIFMCANTTTGQSRRARLTSIPQAYSGVTSDMPLIKWGAAAATAGVIYLVKSATSTTPSLINPITTPVDGQIELVPGEWCVWYRNANTNAVCNIVAKWEYYNLT